MLSSSIILINDKCVWPNEAVRLLIYEENGSLPLNLLGSIYFKSLSC